MSLLCRFPYFAQRKNIDVNLLALVYNNFLLEFQNDLRFVVIHVQLREIKCNFQRFRTLSTPVRAIHWPCNATLHRLLTSSRQDTVCTPFRVTRIVVSRTSLTAPRSWNRIMPPSGTIWRYTFGLPYLTTRESLIGHSRWILSHYTEMSHSSSSLNWSIMIK